MSGASFRYRPEIDGLRAVAVLAVVLYHGGMGLPGGYVGVDVFFVVSGYLITSQLLRDLEDGRFSILGFWARRVRRIVPAATVVVTAVLAVCWFALLPRDRETAWAAVSHSVLAANVFFLQVAGYFTAAAEDRPLLHLWSLAVEEQFYLVFPAALALAWRATRAKRLALLAIVGIGLAASLAISQYELARSPDAAFYLLHSRAWELLLGAGIALLPPVDAGWPRVVRETLAVAGLLLIVGCARFYSYATPFPGLGAVPPCLGTALVLIATRSDGDASLWITRCLSWRPVVFVGLISYSLYLIHWPLLAFLDYWSLDHPGLALRAAAVALSLPLAAASWRFVELPFRQPRFDGATRPTLLAGVAALALVGAAGLEVATTTRRSSLFPASVVALAEAQVEARRGVALAPRAELAAARSGRLPMMGGRGETRILVWGDSHARSILPAVDDLAKQCDVGVAVAWHSVTAPVLGFRSTDHWSLAGDSVAFNQAVFEFARDRRVTDVLLAALWGSYRPMTELRAALDRTLSALAGLGIRTWVLREVPRHRVPVPEALIHRELFGTDLRPYQNTAADYARQGEWLNQALAGLSVAPTGVLDAGPLLLEDGRLRMTQGGEALYYDMGHLTAAGARLVAPALRPVFSDCAAAGETR